MPDIDIEAVAIKAAASVTGIDTVHAQVQIQLSEREHPLPGTIQHMTWVAYRAAYAALTEAFPADA